LVLYLLYTGGGGALEIYVRSRMLKIEDEPVDILYYVSYLMWQWSGVGGVAKKGSPPQSLSAIAKEVSTSIHERGEG
jgi:hypothetical protein